MKIAVVTLALLASSAVFAGDFNYRNDVDPFGFEKEHFESTKSRAEVKADLKIAQANGEMLRFGELGAKFVDAPSTKTREQVVAETREAARLGLLEGFGELGPKVATAEQERQIELAGVRAREHVATSK